MPKRRPRIGSAGVAPGVTVEQAEDNFPDRNSEDRVNVAILFPFNHQGPNATLTNIQPRSYTAYDTVIIPCLRITRSLQV